MLQVENLGKRFGRRWIFRGLTFSIEPGNSLLVLGPNGSGKSTLLKTLVGLIPSSEGRVRLPEGDPRRVVGYSALDMATYPHLTVLEHLKLSANLRGCADRAEELLQQVGLKGASAVLASHLSTGMRARLKIALAVQPMPKLLALDEPSASLDETGRTLVEEIALQQLERGALIVATNDPQERRLATHELVMA